MLKSLRDYIPAKLYMAKGDIAKEWYAYYSCRNPITGLMHQFKERKGINYFKKKSERAREGRRLVELINENLREGWSPFETFPVQVSSRTLIEELRDQHQRFVDKSNMAEPTLTNETCAVYKSAMNLFIAWLIKNNLQHLKANEFNKQHAYAYSDYMIQEKKYKGVSYNNKKNYLSAYMGELAEREIIAENYIEKLRSLPITPALVAAFTEKELLRIKAHLIKIKKPELLRFFHFILFGLMRGKGVTKIQLHDINTEKWVILIYGNKGKTKFRYAPTIPKFMRPDLKRLKNKNPGQYYLFSAGLKPGTKPITRGYITRLWRRHIKIELGINKNMYHGKHTGVTMAVNAGKSDRGIQLQGGWKTERQFLTYKVGHGLITNEEFSDMK